MKDEKEYYNGIAVNKSGFLGWLDNFWYHYKWVTIVVAFLTVVLVVCIAQSCSKVNYDFKITYAGPVSLSDEQKANIEKIFSQELPASLAQDAESGVKTDVLAYYIMSKEQIEAEEKKLHPNGSKVYVDRGFITDQQDTFESQLMTGAGSILLLDPHVFESLGGMAESERLVPLTELFEKEHEGAVSKFGIRLGDTELYRQYPALQVLPEDTVLCLHQAVMGRPKNHDDEKKAFEIIAAPAVNQNKNND